jgi:hypothetical protein
MSKAEVLFLLMGYFFSTLVIAGQYHSVENPEITIRSLSPQTEYSNLRRIEFCNNGQCQIFPNSDYIETGFSNEENWENIFDQCENWEARNNFYNVTTTIASIATFWNGAGVAVQGLKGSSAIASKIAVLRRWRAGRFLTDSAVIAGGQATVNSASTLPYPEISEESVNGAEQIFSALLQDNNYSYYFPQNIVLGLEEVLRTCTSRLDEQIYERETRRCMSGCHGESNTDTESYKVSPCINYDEMTIAISNQYTISTDLLDYLKNLE